MLPESEFEMAGKTAGWSDFAAMAQATEECGFDSIWFADHLQLKLPDGRDQGAWECWSILSAIAATTTRIELGPFVTATAYRNPALLARIALVCAPMAQEVSAADPDDEEGDEDQKEDVEPHGGGPFPRDSSPYTSLDVV